MTRSLPAALLSLLLGTAFASPASDLFRAATSQVSGEYYGWATADFSALVSQYGQRLSEQCAPQAEACDYATARSVLKSLFDEYGDAHTNVRDPEAAERLREIMEDRAVLRTGLRTVKAEGGLLVVSVMPESPAARAGFRRFDLLTRVNGQEAGLRGGQDSAVMSSDFIRLERTGQPLTVTLRRAGQPDQEWPLTSAKLKARDVPTLSLIGAAGRVGLIDFPSFLSDDSAALFLKTVRDAQRAGAQSLIVDLRFNGGGSLAQCVAAASVFGPVIYRAQQSQGKFSYYGLNGALSSAFAPDLASSPPQTAPDGQVWKGPAAVLVGPNTASCAEVFTHFAQQAGVKVAGEPTKGVGNSGVLFHDLPDGGLVAVTVLRAFDALWQPLPAKIRPDIAVVSDIAKLTTEGQDTALQAALDALQASPAAGSAH